MQIGALQPELHWFLIIVVYTIMVNDSQIIQIFLNGEKIKNNPKYLLQKDLHDLVKIWQRYGNISCLTMEKWCWEGQ